VDSRRNEYDRLHQTAELRFPIEDYPHFFEWLHIPKNSGQYTLLDIACGQGFFLEAAAKLSSNVSLFGVDFSITGLNKARTRFSRVLCCMAESLPFPTSSFDYCTNLGSLEHMEHPEKVLSEMYRVLKPSGKAMVIVPNRYYLGNIWRVLAYGEEDDQEQEGVTEFRTLTAWEKLFLKANLDVTGVQGYNGVDHIAWYFKRPQNVITEFERSARWFLDVFVKPCIPLNLSQCFVFFLRRQPVSSY